MRLAEAQSEIPLIEVDFELLDLLSECSDEELRPLVGYILGPQGDFRFTSQLDLTRVFRREGWQRPSRYYPEIAAEIQKFGGHTVMNRLREGRGVPYREVARDVAQRMGVPVRARWSVEEIEERILGRVVSEAFERMTSDERRELFGLLGTRYQTVPRAFQALTLQKLLRRGGLSSPQIAALVANGVAKALLNQGIRMASRLAGRRATALLSGPFAWGLTSAWSIHDLAGPAYRVTVPCVLHCAYLRQTRRVHH